MLENFSRRAARALGLTYEDLRAVREDVVLASISAFGRTGPWGDYVALHSGVILLSGLASVTRDDRRAPSAGRRDLPRPARRAPTWPSRSQQARGCSARATGDGCHVEVSMLDVLLHAHGRSGARAPRTESAIEPDPARFLPTREPGRFVAVAGATPMWTRRGRRPDPARGDGIACRPPACAAAAVLDIGEVIVDPHLDRARFRASPTTIPCPGRGSMAGGAVAATTGTGRCSRHAPRLGEHTDEVLAELAADDREDVDAAARQRGALLTT